MLADKKESKVEFLGINVNADTLSDLGSVSLKDLRLRQKINHAHYFLIKVDLEIVLIFLHKKIGRYHYDRNLNVKLIRYLF
jgi:hypothetical protein